jgi:hypothetical protein
VSLSQADVVVGQSASHPMAQPQLSYTTGRGIGRGDGRPNRPARSADTHPSCDRTCRSNSPAATPTVEPAARAPALARGLSSRSSRTPVSRRIRQPEGRTPAPIAPALLLVGILAARARWQRHRPREHLRTPAWPDDQPPANPPMFTRNILRQGHRSVKTDDPRIMGNQAVSPARSLGVDAEAAPP